MTDNVPFSVTVVQKGDDTRNNHTKPNAPARTKKFPSTRVKRQKKKEVEQDREEEEDEENEEEEDEKVEEEQDGGEEDNEEEEEEEEENDGARNKAMPELRKGVRRGRARVAHQPSDPPPPPPSRRTRATVKRQVAEAVVRSRTRLAVKKLKEEEVLPEPEKEKDRVIVISDDSDSEGEREEEEEENEAVMADDSGGLSANKAAGQEEEGSTAPFPEKEGKKAERRDRTPQYRASLQSFNEKMKTYKGMISPDVMLRLNRTPFWEIIYVFHHGLLKDRECRKVDEDILRMVKTYDVNQKGFLLGERILKITREDVAICLGMRLEGVTFELNKHHQKPTKNRIIDKYFGDAKKVTKAMVDSALAESLKDPRNQVEGEVASLIVMSLFVSFLFCTSGSTLSWKLVEICTEWNSWRRYSWATLVLDHLHNGLSKKQEDKDVNLSGCLPLIMYWLAEKTKMGGAIKRNELGSPNFIRWSLVELHKEMEKLTNEQIEEMFDRKLTEEDLEVAMHDIRGRNRGVASEESNEELREEDFVTPTFGDWHKKTTQERRKEEAESQKRMKDIIDSLEEATTQTSLSQEENQKTQDLLKKLTEENEKLARQNDRYWEMLDKAFEEDNIATRKIQILQNKLLKKWKVFTTIEKEKKNLDDVIEQQRETIHNLEKELLEMERKLLEKDMLDSQEDLRKDDIENSKSDGEDDEEEGGEGADGEDGEEEGEEGADGEDGGDDDEDKEEEHEVRTTRKKHTAARKDKRGRSSQKQEAKKQSRRRERVKKAAAEEEPEEEAADEEEEPEEEPIKKMKKGKKQAVKINSMVDRIKNKKRKATEDKEFTYTTKRTRSGKRH